MSSPLALPERLPRYEMAATILAHARTREGAFEIVFLAPPIASVAQPGQFLEILFGDNYAPLVRRPFSLYEVDREQGTLAVLYRASGSFTSGLMQKRAGETVSLLGPLGQPYRWSLAPEMRHILIAGGIGAPPICFLATEMCRALGEAGPGMGSLIVLNAARTADQLMGMTTFSQLPLDLRTVTDDGSRGPRGLATDVLTALLDAPSAPPTRLYACGPMPMLRAIGEIARPRNLSCQISVETSMPCGIGTCMGCVVPVLAPDTLEGFVYARACCEGPVFEASELLWR